MLVPTLYQFFRRQVQQGFGEQGIAEPATVDYVSDVLTRMAHTAALYPLRDAEGTPLERIAQFLLEWQRADGLDGERADRSRQALITRHLAEYTLFMSGLFRDRLQARGEVTYYMEHGRSAFRQSAHYESNYKRKQVFRRLGTDFTRVANTLDHMRRVQLPMDSATAGCVAALWRR
jgi:hypothetical protein